MNQRDTLPRSVNPPPMGQTMSATCGTPRIFRNCRRRVSHSVRMTELRKAWLVGLNYRRRKRLGKSAWLNVSRSGASVSRRVGRVTFNSRGGGSFRIARGLSFPLEEVVTQPCRDLHSTQEKTV